MARSRRQELQETVWPSDPWTAIKHLIYRHYVNCWMPKILQRFPNAVIADVFSGPGIYGDGAPGSPIVFGQAYGEHRSVEQFRRLDIITLEVRDDRTARLRSEIGSRGLHKQVIFHTLEPGKFHDRADEVIGLARKLAGNNPVLWVVDPFAADPVPIDTIRKCLSGPRDELLLTLFTDTLFRFAGREKTDHYAPIADRQYGSDSWRKALSFGEEGARKDAFVKIYRNELERIANVHTASLDVRVKNHTPLYTIVFATHNEYGLKCWTPVAWRLDGYAGKGISAQEVNAPTLFEMEPDLSELRRVFEYRAGTTTPWRELTFEAHKLNFQEKHVRKVLAELALDGMAVRVSPLDSKTDWPDGSVVRFFAPELTDEEYTFPIDPEAPEGDS